MKILVKHLTHICNTCKAPQLILISAFTNKLLKFVVSVNILLMDLSEHELTMNSNTFIN